MTTRRDWSLECTACGATRDADGLPTTCACGQPWLVRYQRPAPTVADRAEIRRGHGMWRFRLFLPVQVGEEPVTLGEGDTPLLAVPRLAEALGVTALLVKDESVNPTGSFKARGMSAAITRAAAAGATHVVVPTAGNAGVALAAYAARAGITARIYAPSSTPATILDQVRYHGGDLQLVEGHIGDCGRLAAEWCAAQGAYNVSTLREPYRIEGKKTLGFDLALQLGWRLPDVIIYPTGGGTGLIGMWKAFQELLAAGWVVGPPPRLFTVQSDGCAPVVQAFRDGDDRCTPWPNPVTVASGLRVPGPLGDRLMLQALRESGGGAVAVSDDDLLAASQLGTRLEGIDLGPEGGAAVAAVRRLVKQGTVRPDERIVIFNTGAGWLYR